MQGKFRVGLTSDVGDKQTFKPNYYGIEALDDHDGIEWEFMEGDSDPLIPDDVRGYDALLVFGRRVSAETLPASTGRSWRRGSASGTTRSTSGRAPTAAWP